MLPRVGLVVTHPIQYYAPWYRALAQLIDLEVLFCHDQRSTDHARSEFGIAFDWDVPLLEGYRYRFLTNRAKQPDVSHFAGCDTPELPTLIQQRQYDAVIVQGWYVKSYWQAISACWRMGIPVLVRGDSHLSTPRTPAKRLTKALAYRAFIPRFAAYLYVGKRNRDYYLHYGANPKRLVFAPHAVDNQRFAHEAARLKSQRAALRAQWGLPADGMVALFVGKLVARKAPHDFILALALAGRHNQHICGLIVGEGPQRAELEAAALNSGVTIRFTGFLNQSQITQAYVAADLLVLPSDGSETWGLVVNEAMACGLPALVSDQVGCAPDLI
ncbi:MAG: glycosyltransferase family 4 protein, partial [Oscillochloridaceae bacterium umkhey_bin13]